jgi:PAS domain S-box-containing protein
MEKKSKSILIVDDVADNLTVLSELLIEEGYQVRPVTSGAMALKTIETSIPDLILLDIKMPEMDGFQVCRLVKSNDKYKDIPVIFISAHGEEPEKVKAFEAGGVDYIIKPFHAGEIFARVKTHLTLSDTKKAIEQMNFDLGKKVFQRTRELEESNLHLKKSEEMFSKAFQSNPVIITISALSDGKIIEVNKAFEEHTGYSNNEVAGKTNIELNLWAEPDKAEPLFKFLKQRGSYREYELEFVTKSGERRTGLYSGEVVEFASEPCVLTVIEDITERKKADEQIKKQIDELQRWYNVTVNREDRIMELKNEVNQLLARLNEPPRYNNITKEN